MIGADPSISTAENYRRFGELQARGSSPLYEEISIAIADDQHIVSLLGELPVQKRQPNLLLGTVRYLYGTVADYTEFRRLVIERWASISETMLTKRTQTNEVGRCAVLLPVLAQLQEPLHLLEVGASAGLCLSFEEYCYDYGDTVINRQSPAVLRCELRGAKPPTCVPKIGWRMGIDIHPLDPRDADDRKWLEALVWPGMDERATRLHHALDLARQHPALVRQADLRDGLDAFIDEAPSTGTRVVFHSAVMAYVSSGERARFEAQVRESGVTWISCETVGDRNFTLSLDGEPIAKADGHGSWIEMFTPIG